MTDPPPSAPAPRRAIRPPGDPQLAPHRVQSLLDTLPGRIASDRLAEQARLLELAHDAIFVRDLHHAVKYWNQGAARLFGWAIDEALGGDLRVLLPDLVPDLEGFARQLAHTGDLVTETLVTRKAGDRIWVSTAWTLVRSPAGAPDRVMAIARDVTQRKQDPQELQRSRALLETAQSIACLGSMEVDLRNGRILRTSGLDAMFGWQRAPRDLGELAGWLTQASARELAAALPDARNHCGAFDLELQSSPAAGGRWLRVRRPEADLDTSVSSTLVFQDVTAMRAAREQVLLLNRNLERRVARRTRQLAAANRELEAFSYSVSHDLKAPLAALGSFADVLARRLDDRLDTTERGYFLRVKTGVANMHALIDAMLALHDLSRSLKPVRKQVDLSALAREVFDELREREPGRRARLVVQEDIRAECDPALLQIVLRNLLGNAWKFSSKKAETLIAVRASREEPGGCLHLKVSDNGAGFAPELAERLFAPFQRLHHAGDFPGSGVGLATVQRIIHAHGGTVQGDAVPDQGATFCITLPPNLPGRTRL